MEAMIEAKEVTQRPNRRRDILLGAGLAVVVLAILLAIFLVLRPESTKIFGVVTPRDPTAGWLEVVVWPDGSGCEGKSLDVTVSEKPHYVVLDSTVRTEGNPNGACPAVEGGGSYITKTVRLNEPIGDRAIYDGSRAPENRVPTIAVSKAPTPQPAFLR